MSGIIEVTKVHVRIPKARRNPRLLGFADFTLADAVIVRDARIVRTATGRLSVQMPNRPHRVPCPTCRSGVSPQSHFCSHCGEELPIAPELVDFHDLVHPAHQRQRNAIESAVLHAWVDATTDVTPLRVVSA